MRWAWASAPAPWADEVENPSELVKECEEKCCLLFDVFSKSANTNWENSAREIREKRRGFQVYVRRWTGKQRLSLGCVGIVCLLRKRSFSYMVIHNASYVDLVPIPVSKFKNRTALH